MVYRPTLKKKDIIMGSLPHLVRVAVTKCDASLLAKIKAQSKVKAVEPMGVASPATGRKLLGPV